MARPQQRTPTEREMELLQILWRDGPLSTKNIVAKLNDERRQEGHKALAYTSVHTILTIMIKKGLVSKGKDKQSTLLHAVHSREEIEARCIQALKRNIFGGSTMHLVSRALSTHVVSEQDLAKIQDLLTVLQDRLDNDDKP